MSFSFCAPKKISFVGDSPDFYNHVKLKFNLRSIDKKENGRIVMKFDRHKTKILFLSPFNQIYFKLFVENSYAVLINVKKKKFWQGDFKQLIVEMWDIDLELEELKMLIIKGLIPERKMGKSDLEFILKKDKKTGIPESVRIQKADIVLNIKVQQSRIKKGKIEFYADLSQLAEGGLSKVLLNE